MSSHNLAIITQSYRNDIEECQLLCESIDRFFPKEVEHYIIVNDEDYNLFAERKIFRSRHLHKKSEIMPKTYFQLPFKVMGHKFQISPLSLPVREWIVQQICKLGIFDIIDPKFDAVMNVDSESVFLKPFDIEKVLNPKGEWMLYQQDYYFEPNHDEYCNVAQKLLKLDNATAQLASGYRYMSNPVIFTRENLQQLTALIDRNAFINWKYRLGNIYRFSENYLYAIFSIYKYGCKNHFTTDRIYLPLIHRPEITSENILKEKIGSILAQDHTLGIILQKARRNDDSADQQLSFTQIKDLIHSYF